MAQLKMYWFPGTPIPSDPLPEGFAFSNYAGEKDKADWVEICKHGLVGDDADDAAFDGAILSREDVEPAKDVFFLDYCGEHIGTFTAYIHKDENIGDFHMVGIREDFRGRGLSRFLSAAACRKLEAEGCRFISLTTDEWRKSAVKSYLTAGFLPVEYDMNMENRWNAVLEEYGIGSVQMVYEDGSPYKMISRKGLTKKIRFGVFGAARGRTFMSYCKEFDDAELVAVCDANTERCDEIRSLFDCSGVTFYDNFDSFLAHNMDAVCLANYANEHAPYAIRALKAGKHVISEVLPVQTMKEAVDLIEAVEATGKVYAYAENYCYMPAPKEMARLAAEGAIGSFEYGEGEYMHNCEDGWAGYSCCDPFHWRNTMSAFYYCTHSLGPLIHISRQRPVKVVGFEAPFNARMARMGAKAGPFALEIVTLENGAILKSIHGVGPSKNSVWYSVYGSMGRLESAREDAEAGGVRTLYGNLDSAEGANDGKTQTLDTADSLSEFSEAAGHGGSDAYVMFNFVQRLKGNRNTNTVDVYEAMDMFLPGMFAYASVLEGGVTKKIPDLRDPAERDRWRNDRTCTDPKDPANTVIPSYSKGNPEIPPETYELLRRQLEKKREEKRQEEKKNSLTLENATSLAQSVTSEEHLLIHAKNVCYAMGAMAAHFGEDVEHWQAIGMLHDYDYEAYPEEHLQHTEEPLLAAGISPEDVRAILSHGYGILNDIKPETPMEKSLFTVDELTGIIQACARMRPQGITDLEVKSFMKKFKDKKFAAKCDRELIRQGCEMLGMDVAEVAAICIEGMREHAGEIGLLGTEA